ncbi:hypothetical protein HRG_003185 [Hirsutella rhossiliensis]|uniref:Monooxygenase n=1 Tax=Hirsutella rhossiliensis TaxID=111463 RepID=A0A9P8N1K0_9HYPO|nr:uncharacterized protein HRG_03185 [Hirsutella rhossiliensis]KAH0965169.1 hypothetical protein HRG_03185 [Hirsutella rhossiliensis]
MAAAEFKPEFAPSSAPHKLVPKDIYTRVVKGFFVRFNSLLVAAAVQLLFCLVLPEGYAIVPAAVLLLAFATTALAHRLSSSAGSNPYVAGVVRGRVTAQLPSAGGTLGPTPAERGLVVFNLGIQWNHALGPLCPGGPAAARHFLALNADLMRRRHELGILTASEWRGAGLANASTFNLTYYFRDVESIHRVAHEDLHRSAWNWYNQGRFPHIGVFHETFVVPARAYETIYANCVPVGLGRGTVKCDDVKNLDEQWVNTLVNADVPALKTQALRLSRDADMRLKT